MVDDKTFIQLWSCNTCHFSWKQICLCYSKSIWFLQYQENNRQQLTYGTYNKSVFDTYNDNIDDNDTIIIATQNENELHILPRVHDRIKLIYIDDEYTGLTQGICGTVSGIYAANEISKCVSRYESIIWVKWDNGIELGLIGGVDKYEIVSAAANTNSNATTITNTTTAQIA